MTDHGWQGWAPGRINLIGEHVDYMGGPVLPLAINLETRVNGHPAPDWQVESEVARGEKYLRALGEELQLPSQQVRIISEVPVGAGLASSAALLVALASGLAPELSGVEVALATQRAEQRATGVRVGVMDQFISALGQRGCALLLNTESLAYRLVPFSEELSLAVIDSGIYRNLTETPYNQRRREAESGLAKRRRHVESEIDRVYQMVDALKAVDQDKIGELLQASHRSLRDDFEVSTPEIDALAERIWAVPGCLGARIMGAGFGGSILAVLRRGDDSELRQALPGSGYSSVSRPLALMRGRNLDRE
ncbi:MAG: galactokinase [Candidatus Dormibacteraceae bacterium]